MKQTEPPPPPRTDEVPLDGAGLVRAAFGGGLMGLANLVPGISGGTMLLAVGVYPRFIRAAASVSRLRLRPAEITLLGTVGVAAVVAVAALAGPMKQAVVAQRWVMYSLFIGLTLGGVPVIWRLVRPAGRSVVLGATAGFLVMADLAWAQVSGAGAGASGVGGAVMLTAGGIAGAASMILPGVSGGYLLLVLGQYLAVLGAIDRFTDGLLALDAAQLAAAAATLIPFGIGVLVGVAGVSNLLQYLLRRFARATFGVLLGLLVGAVVGLWPFQQSVPPIPGETMIRGQEVTTENLATFDVEDWPVARFDPNAGQVAGALGLVLSGFALTALIVRVSTRLEKPRRAAS